VQSAEHWWGQREGEQEQGECGGGSRWQYGSGNRGCDAVAGTKSVVVADSSMAVGVDGGIVVKAEGTVWWQGQSAG